MDFLKSQFDRIQQQLGGLSASQKMLTAALVAIMGLTLLYWARYAGQPEMEALLSQPLSDEEVRQITTQLKDRGIRFEESADHRILVPADRRIEIIGSLGFDQQLPKNTASGFDEIIKQLTPWDGQDREGMFFNRAKEITLGRVIGAFPGVASATVSIDPRFERRISPGGNIEPTAFVNMSTKDGMRGAKKLVEGAASLVAGAQAGLQTKNIHVVVNGAPQRVTGADDPDDAIASTIYERREAEERRIQQKLAEQFPDIQGLMVSVTVSVDPTSSEKNSSTFGTIQTLDAKTESQSTEQTGGAPAPPAEPGATPNVGGTNGVANLTAPAAGAAAESSHTTNRESVESKHYPNREEIRTHMPPGQLAVSGVSVRVPRSHFVRIAKAGAAAEPEERVVAMKTSEEQQRIRKSLMACSGVTNPAGISVEPYYDEMPAVAAAPGATAASSAVTLALGGHVKEIALGALALLSLFMVSTIVRKGTPAPAVAAAPKPRLTDARPAPTMLDGREPVAGEVGEGNAMLDGMELDEESVKTQQMLDQVSTLVTQNPDAAASLVKRWLNRS
jgi:flagellar biosynthesis/type III secretory pathway M-ring protein FliF/YscJ